MFGNAEVDVVMLGNGSMKGFNRIFGEGVPIKDHYSKVMDLMKYPSKKTACSNCTTLKNYI